MTVNTTIIKAGPYPGNGVADTFSYGFRVVDKTQLIVYETDDLGVKTVLTVDTDYTVNGVGIDSGGTVTRAAGVLPINYEWFIRADYKLTQLTAIPSQGAYFPVIHEDVFDKLTFINQQQQEELVRSTKAPVDDDGTTDFTFPAYDADKAIVWDKTDKKLVNSPGNIGDATAAAAAALVSENASKASEDASKVSEDLANKWAQESIDVPVTPNNFSAFHWAKKAESLTNGMRPMGGWDGSTGAYPVTFTIGDFYYMTEPGKMEGTFYNIKDSFYRSNRGWEKLKYSDGHKSFRKPSFIVSNLTAQVNHNVLVRSDKLGIFLTFDDASTPIPSTSGGGSTWVIHPAVPAVVINILKCIWVDELNLFIAAVLTSSGHTSVDIMTSSDGVVWVMNAGVATTDIVRTIVWSPDLNILIVNSYTTGSNYVTWTSTDGLVWTRRTEETYLFFPIDSVWAAKLNLFVVVGNLNGQAHTNIITSPDGIVWTMVTSGDSGSIQYSNLAWSEELSTLVAVRSGVASVATSQNGIDWTTTSIPQLSYTLAWIPENGVFIAGGFNTITGIITSADGVKWFEHEGVDLSAGGAVSLSSIVKSSTLDMVLMCANSSATYEFVSF